MAKIPGNLSRLQKRDPKLTFRSDEKLGVMLYLRGNLAQAKGKTAQAMQSEALNFLRLNPELFGRLKTEQMTVLQKSPDPHGGTTFIYQQHHGKYRVFGGSVRFHFNKNAVLESVTNKSFPDLDKVPLEPLVSVEKAVKEAQASTGCKAKPERKPEIMVYRHKGEPRLVYEIRMRDIRCGMRGAPAQWVVFVDAITDKTLLFYDNFQTGGPVSGFGNGVYSVWGALNSYYNDTSYQLRDTTRTPGGPEIICNDEDGASPSEDPDNNWDDNTTSPREANQGAEVDAHRYTGDVWSYFNTTHGRNSFDDAGANMITTVHYKDNYCNGGWNGSIVVIGDGDGTSWDYLCTDDCMAHEFTHAVTEHTCNLTYSGESGALNEAFSDIFAAFITHDWLVMEDAWLGTDAPASRNMMDPTNGGKYDGTNDTTVYDSVTNGHQPSHYDNLYTGTLDNNGVHINSGIINNLFYLLTVGGTHTISNIAVSGIGQSAADQLLYRCMSVELVGQPDATFLDFRHAMMDACLTLFPGDLFKLTQVKNAFNAVGIGPDIFVRDNLADTGQEPYPGSYLWASPDIINRNSLSADPDTDFADLNNDSLWQNVQAGQNNYIYVRLQNRGNHSGDALISLYFSPAAAFGTPASWIHIGNLTEAAIVPGELRIAGPLTFPSGQIPAPGHYCMIAVVSDPLDPPPDTTLIASLNDYLDFVRNSNNIAYRNMDVEPMSEGLTASFSALIQQMKGMRERYDIQFELPLNMPGIKIRIHGPSLALDGAVPRGLKLVARAKGQNFYELFLGRKLEKEKRFLAARKEDKFEYGFDNILIDKNFKIAVDYVLPEKELWKEALKKVNPAGYCLAVKQIWKGQVLGRAGLHFVAPGRQRPAAKEPPKHKAAKKRK